MAKVVIVYHSGFGHTRRVAEHVVKGAAAVVGVQASLLTADEAVANTAPLDEADCIVFGAPTYMGGPSAPFKSFIDATSRRWLSQTWKDKLAAGFTNSGSYSGDKQGTLLAFVTLAMQHGMVWVGQAEMTRPADPNAPKSLHGASPDAVNRLGSHIGLMTQSDNAPPEQTPSPGDLRTAELFGERIARATLRWVRGRG